MAGFQILLHRYAGQEDVLVGTPVAGRLRQEFEELVGFFLNTLVIRSQVRPALSFAEFFDEVRQGLLEATENQDLPFEKLLAELQPERSASATPLFQVMLNFANLPEVRLDLPGLEVSLQDFGEMEAKVDLNLYLMENGGGLDLQLVYDADLFDRARMVELLAQYVHLLEQAARRAGAAAGRALLVTAALPRPPARPAYAPLPHAFRGSIATAFLERAAEQPQYPAAEDGDGVLSYAEVEAHSSRLAAALQAAGVGRGDVVAIWAHRSAGIAAALFGILRSGRRLHDFRSRLPGGPPPRLRRAGAAQGPGCDGGGRPAAVPARGGAGSARHRAPLARGTAGRRSCWARSRSAKTTSPTSPSPPARPACPRRCSAATPR